MPPPKPGVIPLRPLSLGDIYGGAFATMGRYWKQLFGVGAAVYGGALVVVGAAVAIAYSAVSDPLHRVIGLSSEESPSTEDIVPLVIAFGAVWLVAVLVLMTATAMMYATVPAVLQDAVLGRPTTFGIIWRRAWARVPAVIGTVLLTSLVAVIPVVLMMVAFIAMTIAFITLDSGSGSGVAIAVGILGVLATAPLAIWLWVKFSLAPAAAVFEGQRPIVALRRSSQLVRGDWWRIFGISLLAMVTAAVASYIIQLPFSILGMFPGMIGMESLGSDPNPTAVIVAMSGYLVVSLLGQLVGQLVSATFPQLVTGLLYVDRRMRNENLGPVLAEAAAVPPQFGP
ncbi:hypothetical protein OG930_11130 [Streptomyces sp. NBC_01799]|uniref:DUF7847 domain-containing protein n=1 Tax=Streptomyces sp. NBC_01800 TaxID=2975945 RepID=UPI002DD8CDF1|nr:hypothetical protein [Streptomyces sp. NBC_01800]WSA67510.1 hypothetical protein OIE65_11265 [Streptomyces sp. NBC_01800]WSA76100.1 hypothetical protein OG930_11130 [Streptomyces sp. NBC_01799]